MQYIDHYNSPVGPMTMASDGVSLIGLWFNGSRFFCESISEKTEKRELTVFQETKHWLDLYFQGEIPDFSPQTALKGSDFRLLVWKLLQKIPYGETVSYGEIAKRIATETGHTKMSARAVGGAVGHNPISILIPCHRVVGANGNLIGYGGGIDKKVALLTLEKVNREYFFIPKKERNCE